MREVYLDNGATTFVLPEVVELMSKIMMEDYGNPSSLHNKGFDAEKYITGASKQISKTLKCKPNEIIFTSGGTESNNMALIGAAIANKRAGKHIITTCFEHASVHEPLFFLEENGFEVTYLPVDNKGHLDIEALKESLRDDTILVSTMMVNNEIGSILQTAQINSIAHEYNKKIVCHVDAIQAYGKLPINPKKMDIDLMSVSGHKIHAPKGIGFLYCKEGTKIRPIIFGGGQQKKMRSGTENVPGIAGLGYACEYMTNSMDANREHLYELKKYFVEEISKLDGTTVNACDNIDDTAPHVVSVSFENIRSEVLLHALEDKGIFVSSGSACSSNHPGISGTLQAIGVKKELLESTIRFSFCKDTSKEDLTYTIDALKELTPILSKYVRR